MTMNGQNIVKGYGKDLGLSNFTSTEMRNVNLDGANLKGAYLIKSVAPGASFRGADLSDALMDRAIFVDADFQDAVLVRVVLTLSDLKGANVSHPAPVPTNQLHASLLTHVERVSCERMRQRVTQSAWGGRVWLLTDGAD